MSFILIVGAGRVGSSVARAMLAQGHDVSVLDEDPLSHERLDSGMDTTWEDAGGRFTLGHGLEIDALREAGIEEADVFIASTDGDNTNLTISQIAAKHYQVPRVIVRVMDPARAEWYAEQGLHTICPTSYAIEMFEHAIQYGDATELWVLERAGINRADLTIAVTGDDEDNLLICQLAKEKYLCERIIARVNNPRNRQYFELLGIQPAVSATDLILRLIEHEVPSYGTVHLLDLRDEQLEIIEVEVPDGSPVIGRRIREIELPDGALIISILREGKGFVPKADTVIQDGDEVLLVLDPGLEERITEQFASNRSEA